jgi:hypothetical protein
VPADTGLLTLTFMGGETPPPSTGREVNKWIDDCGYVCGRAFSCENLHWIDLPGLGVFAFSVGTHEVRVWPEANASRETIVQAFSRMLQPVILQALGWGEALHAGATAGPEGVLAFCGKSGSGKSTLAFAMQQIGWRQFADDLLVLRRDGDCVTACSLGFTPRLRPASRAHFAKAPVHLSSSPQPLPANAALTAVFLLEQNERLTVPKMSLMPQVRAFLELLAHAHCFDAEDPGHIRRLVDSYLLIAECVPVFRLEYRPDLQHLGQLIDAIAETASSGRVACLRHPAVGTSDSVCRSPLMP